MPQPEKQFALGSLGKTVHLQTKTPHLDGLWIIQSEVSKQRYAILRTQWVTPPLKREVEAGEMLGSLTAGSTPAEDPDWVSSTHIRQITITLTSVPGIWRPLLASSGTAHVHRPTHIHTFSFYLKTYEVEGNYGDSLRVRWEILSKQNPKA